MRAVEFCYWLQGYFELGNPEAKDLTLTVGQVRTIRAHLNLVQRCDPKHDNLFVEWLSTFIAGGENRILNASDTAKVKRLLARQFKHEIDPSYDGDNDELQAVHDGHPAIGGTHPTNPHVVYRC